MYWQGGRVITTLAMAWPHPKSRRNWTRSNKRARRAQDDRRALWFPKGSHPARERRASCELHTFHEPRGWDRYWAMGNKKPAMGSFYGLCVLCRAPPETGGDQGTLSADHRTPTRARRSAISTARWARTSRWPASRGNSRIRRDEPGWRASGGRYFSNRNELCRHRSRHPKVLKECYGFRQRRGALPGVGMLSIFPQVGRYLSDHVKRPRLNATRKG